MEELQARLAVLDEVFPLHTVQVDPKAINGSKKYTPPMFNYGAMPKRILECLRLANGRPIYTSAIAAHVAVNEGFEINQSNKARLMRRVSDRINALAHEGSIARHHDVSPGNQAEGRWSLADDDSAEAEPIAA